MIGVMKKELLGNMYNLKKHSIIFARKLIIIYFIRNYEYTDQSLANEISKQFNITESRALEDIEKIKQRLL